MDDEAPINPENPEATFTRVISRTFVLDGVEFSWWAIDQAPALVTVSSPGFGGKADVTSSDPETFARKLAAQILRDHHDCAASMRDKKESESN